jgi:hypothetical protein
VSYDALPYAWSDPYGWKLQMLGEPAGAAQVVEVAAEDGKFVAFYREDGLTGG